MKKVVFVGAANPETFRMIAAIKRTSPNFAALGFLDNDPAKKNTDFYGLPVFGGLECVSDLTKEDAYFVNLITGNMVARYEVKGR